MTVKKINKILFFLTGIIFMSCSKTEDANTLPPYKLAVFGSNGRVDFLLAKIDANNKIHRVKLVKGFVEPGVRITSMLFYDKFKIYSMLYSKIMEYPSGNSVYHEITNDLFIENEQGQTKIYSNKNPHKLSVKFLKVIDGVLFFSHNIEFDKKLYAVDLKSYELKSYSTDIIGITNIWQFNKNNLTFLFSAKNKGKEISGIGRLTGDRFELIKEYSYVILDYYEDSKIVLDENNNLFYVDNLKHRRKINLPQKKGKVFAVYFLEKDCFLVGVYTEKKDWIANFLFDSITTGNHTYRLSTYYSFKVSKEKDIRFNGKMGRNMMKWELKSIVR